MKYKDIIPAQFLSRPNRFIAHIEVGGRGEICHVKNTGRCRELLLPGADIFVQKIDSDVRQTKYDLIGVRKGQQLINIDSQAPNRVFREWIEESEYFAGVKLIKPEYRYNRSRFDFYLEAGSEQILVEVKGVTLEEDGEALFPDAPTLRGLKHITDLCQWAAAGNQAYLVFIIQMTGVSHFAPNYQTHQAFGEALEKAVEQGVKLLALDCEVGMDFIRARDFVEVKL